MRTDGSSFRREGAAFTLIELLVVVAIIALLISILLPSLSRAREQARTTLCFSRIAQLTKTLMIYAGDFDETPPFVGLGFENLGSSKMNEEWPAGSGITRADYARNENWLIPQIPIIWNLNERDWEAATDGQARVRNGSLFTYARFENLYRCPEFERIANKEQQAFNLTRSVLGRKLLCGGFGDGLPKPGDLAPGPILKLSTVYAPGSMFMLMDEQWDFHVAGNYNGNPARGIIDFNGFDMWMGAESCHAFIADCIGDYHSVKGKDVDLSLIGAAKKGSVSFYDGHVELVRDPLPGRILTISNPLDLLNDPDVVQKGIRLLSPFILQIFAQRGLNLDIMEVVSWFL